jgi:hypothetical protein
MNTHVAPEKFLDFCAAVNLSVLPATNRGLRGVAPRAAPRLLTVAHEATDPARKAESGSMKIFPSTTGKILPISSVNLMSNLPGTEVASQAFSNPAAMRCRGDESIERP